MLPGHPIEKKTSTTLQKIRKKYYPVYYGNESLMFDELLNGELTYFTGKSSREYKIRTSFTNE
jgi:hypothetical protein